MNVRQKKIRNRRIKQQLKDTTIFSTEALAIMLVFAVIVVVYVLLGAH